MLRKPYGGAVAHQVKSTVGSIFLSNSARNKKYDGERVNSFDFSEIQKAIKSKSFQELLDHELFPIILVTAVLCFIIFLYIIIAVFSSSFIFSSELSNNLIEVEEILSKLMQLRKNGNMKEYEEFLQPSMQKYCLNDLGSSYFDTPALESFHMNLAETISFIARGGKFTEHNELAVNQMGGIIDPSNSKDSTVINQNTKSCPLLTALYELGAAKKSNTKTEKTENKDEENDDGDDRFDQRYSWTNMEEFMQLISRSLSGSGECLRVARELNKDKLKVFILNFYEMADIIGRATEKEEAAGDYSYNDFVVDPTSKDYKKYVIGRDGGIYETDKYDVESDEYLKCRSFEMILNDKFVLDENLSYTNVKIAMDETFDDWYQNFIKKIQ